MDSLFLWQSLGSPNLQDFVVKEKLHMLKTRQNNVEKNSDKFKSYESKITELKKGITFKRVNQETCAFCGIHYGTIKTKDVISSGFTNVDILRNIESNTVCDYCAICMKNIAFRQSCWIANGKSVKYFKRNDIANVLFAKQAERFAIYITTSFKKLGQLKAVVNYNSENFVVQFEEIKAQFEPKKLKPIFEIMTRFYSIPTSEENKKQQKSFFTKDEIKTGNYSYKRIRDYGINKWKADEIILRKERNTPAFLLMVYALNQQMLGIAKGDNKIHEKKANNDRRRKTNDGERLDLSNLAVDKLGQRKWF